MNVDPVMHNDLPDPSADDRKTTRDAFLGGLVMLYQPEKGRHRAGLDAVYLAAALPDTTAGHVVDLGAGVGTAGLCAAARLGLINVTLVDIDPLVLKLADRALKDQNNSVFAKRVRLLKADITGKGRDRHEAGLVPGLADHAIMNPPYYKTDNFRASPDEGRAAAHMLDERGLVPWVKTAADIVKPAGSLTMIFRADGFHDVLDALSGRFGAIDVVPLHPRPGTAASRILIRAIRASRAPLQMLPGLILHNDKGNEFATQSDAVLRRGAGLNLLERR